MQLTDEDEKTTRTICAFTQKLTEIYPFLLEAKAKMRQRNIW